VLTGRRAFSLAELLVAIVLTGVIAATAMDVLARHLRFYAGEARRAAARAAVRQGGELLATELRALSPLDGDLYDAGPDHVDFRMLLGSSVLCVIAPARDAVVLPPLHADSKIGLTAWVAAPVRGDTALVLGDDERWARHVLLDDPRAGARCPAATGFTQSAAEEAAGWSVRFAPPLGAEVRAGAPVRFVRRARFELYRASDARWYLGFLDCLATRATPCSVVQPVSGPYDPGGLRFVYLDSSGSAGAGDAARIVIDLAASAAAERPGVPAYRDSLRLTVAPRR
jgi:prepilin-type N-terminal cleavage/methylation domain-containing protein